MILAFAPNDEVAGTLRTVSRLAIFFVVFAVLKLKIVSASSKKYPVDFPIVAAVNNFL